MAKNPPQDAGRSKVRIFYVDAELAPGDLQELTRALTSAIRPVQSLSKEKSSPRLGIPTEAVADETAVEDAELIEISEDYDEIEKSSPSRAPSKPRKYRQPKIVNDLDMSSGGKSFESFVIEKGNPSEHTPRYLIAAYWLSEYAKVSPVTVDHVYTCYKSADGWTFDVSDPGFPFRALKKDGLGDTKNGKFTINHIGQARVEKMKPETKP